MGEHCVLMMKDSDDLLVLPRLGEFKDGNIKPVAAELHCIKGLPPTPGVCKCSAITVVPTAATGVHGESGVSLSK